MDIVVEEIFRAERGGVKSANVMRESWEKSKCGLRRRRWAKTPRGREGLCIYVCMYVHIYFQRGRY